MCIRDSGGIVHVDEHKLWFNGVVGFAAYSFIHATGCLLYTSRCV